MGVGQISVQLLARHDRAVIHIDSGTKPGRSYCIQRPTREQTGGLIAKSSGQPLRNFVRQAEAVLSIIDFGTTM
jgi:hypothetical protein